MRVFAIHDAEGNISGIATCPSDAPSVGVSLDPGQLMTELDLADVIIDLDDPEGSRSRAAEIIENQRLEIGATPHGNLVSRQYPRKARPPE